MNLSEMLARNSRKFSDREAIVDGQVRLTYQELDSKVNILGSSLRELGITKGSKVVLFMPNCKEFIYSYFAVMRLGGIIVPVNAKLGTDELQYIIENSDAEMVIAHEMLYKMLLPLTDQSDVKWIKTGESQHNWRSFETLVEQGSEETIHCTLDDNDEATMLYTSGTTGKPKGVIFTYRNITSVATMMCIETKMSNESCMLHMMPLSHSAPLHLFFAAGLYVGAKHVLSPLFTPDALLQLVQQEKVTHFFGAPVAYLFTAKHPNINNFDLSTVNYWVYGGSPLSAPEVQFIESKFNTKNLMCVYGLTEAGPNGTFLSPRDHETKPGSIGHRSALNCEVRIVDEHGKDVGPNVVGEIILHGEGTMKGYYKDEEKTKATIKNGWLYTGDMAKRDEDGYMWIVDRKKDMIISGGVNIYPKEVEDVLKTHPNVTDVAVIGVPNPDWGETAKAYVVLEGEVSNLEYECKRFLNGKIATYKIPRLYERVDDLPRNATGKILKQELRKRGEDHEPVQG